MIKLHVTCYMFHVNFVLHVELAPLDRSVALDLHLDHVVISMFELYSYAIRHLTAPNMNALLA